MLSGLLGGLYFGLVFIVVYFPFERFLAYRRISKEQEFSADVFGVNICRHVRDGDERLALALCEAHEKSWISQWMRALIEARADGRNLKIVEDELLETIGSVTTEAIEVKEQYFRSCIFSAFALLVVTGIGAPLMIKLMLSPLIPALSIPTAFFVLGYTLHRHAPISNHLSSQLKLSAPILDAFARCLDARDPHACCKTCELPCEKYSTDNIKRQHGASS